jgi:hypothetical protein|tara:strand:+ start:154 stop:804 length:651 start_codon:yes stop_codon:yes gene_type:complete
MALATYTELKTSVANYLNRDDLTSVIPDFISLTENRMNRDLRVRANMIRSTTTTTSGTAFYNLPSDLIELRNITFNTGSQIYALAYLSPESGSREYGSIVSGSPRAYTNLGTNIQLYPAPDGEYTIGINYFQQLTPLSNTVSTNNILDTFPDLYLYGSCLEGATYLNDSDQLQRFAGLYQKALTDVRDAEDSARYSGTVMTMTVQGDPGSLVRRGA